MRTGILALGVILLLIGVPAFMIGEEAMGMAGHWYGTNEEEYIIGLILMSGGAGLAISGLILSIAGIVGTKRK
jgi:hypothetical protein